MKNHNKYQEENLDSESDSEQENATKTTLKSELPKVDGRLYKEIPSISEQFMAQLQKYFSSQINNVKVTSVVHGEDSEKMTKNEDEIDDFYKRHDIDKNQKPSTSKNHQDEPVDCRKRMKVKPEDESDEDSFNVRKKCTLKKRERCALDGLDSQDTFRDKLSLSKKPKISSTSESEAVSEDNIQGKSMAAIQVDKKIEIKNYDSDSSLVVICGDNNLDSDDSGRRRPSISSYNSDESIRNRRWNETDHNISMINTDSEIDNTFEENSDDSYLDSDDYGLITPRISDYNSDESIRNRRWNETDQNISMISADSEIDSVSNSSDVALNADINNNIIEEIVSDSDSADDPDSYDGSNIDDDSDSDNFIGFFNYVEYSIH